MAIFSACLDESGTDSSSPVVVVAGAIASNLNWDKMETAWRAVLRKYNLSRFHASRCNGFYEEFHGWTFDDRLALYKKLTRIINDGIRCIVASGVRIDEYNEVMLRFPHKRKTPYEYCLEKSIFAISHWAIEKAKCKPISIAIEAGQPMSSELLKTWQYAMTQPYFVQKFKIASISIMPKSHYIPFQIADYIAYELFRYQRDNVLGSLSYLRPMLMAAIMGKTSIGYIDTPETIQSWLDSPTLKEIEEADRQIS